MELATNIAADLLNHFMIHPDIPPVQRYIFYNRVKDIVVMLQEAGYSVEKVVPSKFSSFQEWLVAYKGMLTDTGVVVAEAGWNGALEKDEMK